MRCLRLLDAAFSISAVVLRTAISACSHGRSITSWYGWNVAGTAGSVSVSAPRFSTRGDSGGPLSTTAMARPVLARRPMLAVFELTLAIAWPWILRSLRILLQSLGCVFADAGCRACEPSLLWRRWQFWQRVGLERCCQ